MSGYVNGEKGRRLIPCYPLVLYTCRPQPSEAQALKRSMIPYGFQALAIPLSLVPTKRGVRIGKLGIYNFILIMELLINYVLINKLSLLKVVTEFMAVVCH